MKPFLLSTLLILGVALGFSYAGLDHAPPVKFKLEYHASTDLYFVHLAAGINYTVEKYAIVQARQRFKSDAHNINQDYTKSFAKNITCKTRSYAALGRRPRDGLSVRSSSNSYLYSQTSTAGLAS